MPNLADRAADGLIRTLQERHQPGSLWRRLVRLSRLAVVVTLGGYAASLVAIPLLSRFIGEKNPATAFLLFLPQQIFLVPALALLPLAALRSWRWFSLVTAAAAAFLILHMGFAWQFIEPRSQPGNPSLTVLANNRGEDNRQSFTGFVREQNPDLLVLQEDGRADAFRAAYPGYFAESQWRYTLVSRFPIKSSGLLELPSAMPEAVAAWFEIEFAGRSVMVYNVHLPTPRAELGGTRGRGFLLALLPFAPGRLAAKRAQAQAPWDRRLKIVQELEDTLARETRPYILAGDFNAPYWGLVHRRIAARSIDSFAKAGRGFGFTFPGETRNPLTAFGPWLRIDYVFGSHHFRPLSALAEPRRTSQHRCTVARLELADLTNP